MIGFVVDRSSLSCDPGLGMTNRNNRFPEEPLARLTHSWGPSAGVG